MLRHTQPKAEEAAMIQPTKPAALSALLRVMMMAAFALPVAACVPASEPSQGAAAYRDYCAICHGDRGTGDGAIARKLAVPPPDLTTIAARNGGVFPLQQVAASVYGYTGKHEADLMPEFSPLLDGPAVTVTGPDGRTARMPQRLADVVLYLQSLQRL